MKLTDHDFLVISLGGNVGTIGAEALSGAVSGALGLEGAQRNIANIVAKAAFGFLALTASEKATSADKKMVMEGMGTAPIYTIGNEIIGAIAPGMNVNDYVYGEVSNAMSNGGAGSRVRPSARPRGPVQAASAVRAAPRPRVAVLGV